MYSRLESKYTTAIFCFRICTDILLVTVFLDTHRNETQQFLFSHYYFFFFQMLDQRIWDWNSCITLRNACDWSSSSASAFVSEEFWNTMVPLHDAYLYGDKSSTYNSFSHSPVSITIFIIFFCAWKCCFVDALFYNNVNFDDIKNPINFSAGLKLCWLYAV